MLRKVGEKTRNLYLPDFEQQVLRSTGQRMIEKYMLW
jgi:hypothetical protein